MKIISCYIIFYKYKNKKEIIFINSPQIENFLFKNLFKVSLYKEVNTFKSLVMECVANKF